MNTSVDLYFTDGCGRCSLGGTPQCKVNRWREELTQLRAIVLDCGLQEESKWGVPCYTFQQKNILVVAAFKDYCAISFFKGALLADTDGILAMPGENSQSGRLIRFTNVRELVKLKPIIKAYIFEAIEIEKAGLKVEFKKPAEFHIPEEFQHKLDELPALKAAFDALTPGRQKGYLLHFAAPKQAKTRAARVEKSVQHILNGKGLMDR